MSAARGNENPCRNKVIVALDFGQYRTREYGLLFGKRRLRESSIKVSMQGGIK
jgi:hypothetical protein